MLNLFIGVAVALAACLLAKPLGNLLGVVDVPDGGRKLHAAPTPEVGGLAVVFGLVPSMALQAYLSPLTPYFLAVSAAVAGFTAIGYLDDRNHVRPAYRLISGALLTLGLVWFVPGELISHLHFSFLDVAILPNWGFSLAFTVLCVVGLQNALNMADGKNGLALGMLLIWSGFLWRYSPPDLVPVLLTFIGGLAVTWIFNMRGLVFLGDAGTYGLGAAIGLLTIHTYSVSFADLHADVVALWFLVPVVDALRLMVTRVAAGRSPFSADRRHFHHLLQLVFPRHSQLRLATYLALVGVPGAFAAMNADYVPAYAAATVIIYFGIIISARLSAATAQRSAPVRLDGSR